MGLRFASLARPTRCQLGLDPLGDLGLADVLALEAVGDVVLDAQVREQRVALKDGVGRALVRRQAGDVVAVDQDLARVRLLEAGDHPQRRRLAAAARAEQGEELPFRDVEVDGVDRSEIPEPLRDRPQGDAPGLALHLIQCFTCPFVVADVAVRPSSSHIGPESDPAPIEHLPTVSPGGPRCKSRMSQNHGPHLYIAYNAARRGLNQRSSGCANRGSTFVQSVESKRRADGSLCRRTPAGGIDLQEIARKHLWMHFSRMGGYDDEHEIPIIARGEGPYVWDDHGNRYLDALSALFCCNAGHGRTDSARPPPADQGARLLHELELRASALDRARRADRRARPRRSQPRLLHLWARRPSSRRSRSPATGTAPTAAASGTRSSPARSPTTGRRWER